MAYTTHSDSSPDKNTSFINTSLNRLVQNNPYHPTASNILWPTYYDVFVNKTDDQQVSVSVSDEKHITGDINTADNNALYMNHKPRLGSTITSTFGTIDTGLTDYNHGIVYFVGGSLPASDFTLTYLADPDKYYGEYISQMQDVLHKLEIWAGAGSTKNEGVRSAEILVKTTNARLKSKLPNRIYVQGLEKDISFQSLPGLSNHITLGNSEDIVNIDAKEFRVYRGTFGDPNTADPITGTITDHTGDLLNMIGLVNISPTGTTRSTGFTTDDVASGLISGAHRNDGLEDALRVYGNTYIAGNLFTLGDHTVVSVNESIQVNTFQEDLLVQGNTTLGNETDDKVYIGGDLIVSGKIDQIGTTPGKNVTINRDIILDNHDGTKPSLVDGLDPSYIASRHKYMRPAGPDWCGDTVNICSIGQMAEDGTLTGGAASTATEDSATGDLVIDTSISTNEIITGDLHYTGRFDDGTWIFNVQSGPSVGEKIPVAAYDYTATGWKLSRVLSSVPVAGMSYKVYNPYFCNPDFVNTSTANFEVTASTTNPIVANVRGIVKSNIASDNAISISTDVAGYKYLLLANENPGSSKFMETDGVWYGSDYGVPSDQSIIVAEVTSDAGGNLASLITYRPAGKYDSTWRKFGSTTPTIYHNLGGDFRAQDYKVTVHTAGTDATPGTITQVTDSTISEIDRKTAVIEVPSTDTWVRIKIEV